MTMRLTEATMVKATNGVAVGGLTLPAWWPSLMEVSEMAGLLVPILSLIWLSVQIVRTVFKKPETTFQAVCSCPPLSD